MTNLVIKCSFRKSTSLGKFIKTRRSVQLFNSWRCLNSSSFQRANDPPWKFWIFFCLNWNQFPVKGCHSFLALWILVCLIHSVSKEHFLFKNSSWWKHLEKKSLWISVSKLIILGGKNSKIFEFSRLDWTGLRKFSMFKIQF